MFIKIQTNNKKKLKTGTTIVGLVRKDGSILLGADTQVTHNNINMPLEYSKIKKIGSSLLVAGSGSCADIQYISKEISKIIRLKKIHEDEENLNLDIDVSEFSEELQNHLFINSKSFHPFESDFLICGFSKKEDKNILLNVSSDGSLISIPKYFSVGSGSQISLGQLENLYHNSNNLNLQNNQVAYQLYNLLGTTSKLDNYTSPPFEVFSINPRGEITKYVETPIIEEQNQIKKTKPKKDKIENGKRTNKKN